MPNRNLDYIQHAAELSGRVAGAVTHGGASLTGAAAMWAWFGSNYQQIAAVCAIFGVAISLVGVWLNVRSNRRRVDALESLEARVAKSFANKQAGKAKVMVLVSLFTAAAAVVGFEGYELIDYADPVGIPTACFGHTATAEIGKQRTDSECQSLLMIELAEYQGCVLSHSRPTLSTNQLAAFTSFTYNVGCSKFRSSTLLKKLNAGDVVGACNELPRWVYARGVKLNGLVRRREVERLLCLA